MIIPAKPTSSHYHANKVQLDLVTDGDHDVRTDNPHGVTTTQINAVPTTRQVIAGTGLTGGGDLSADRTFQIVPVIYTGSSQYGSLAGVTIALPRNVGSVDDYSVSITSMGNSGFIGEVWCEKAVNGFTVYNSGSDAETEFSYAILYSMI